MNLQTLLGFYLNDNRLKQIAAGLSLPEPKMRFRLRNLKGAFWPLLFGNNLTSITYLYLMIGKRLRISIMIWKA
jgi:hypothetical protein